MDKLVAQRERKHRKIVLFASCSAETSYSFVEVLVVDDSTIASAQSWVKFRSASSSSLSLRSPERLELRKYLRGAVTWLYSSMKSCEIHET